MTEYEQGRFSNLNTLRTLLSVSLADLAAGSFEDLKKYDTLLYATAQSIKHDIEDGWEDAYGASEEVAQKVVDASLDRAHATMALVTKHETKRQKRVRVKAPTPAQQDKIDDLMGRIEWFSEADQTYLHTMTGPEQIAFLADGLRRGEWEK